MARPLFGKAALDLGCGYGENCAAFKRLGAETVTGVDISEKMLAVAKSNYAEIDFICADISDLSFIKDKFDVVFSSLAVHYIEVFPSFVKSVYNLLNPKGYFIFSQKHPVNTAPISGVGWSKDEKGNVLHYNLTDYAKSGKRITKWFVDGVDKYHRTFSDIVNALISVGFIITKMLEPTPPAELIKNDPQGEKGLHKPAFLLMKAWRE